MPVRSPLLEREYIYEHELGQWSFGTTQAVRERKTDALKICKIVPKALVSGRSDVLPRLQQLRELRHPLISTITDVREDTNYYFILSDACGGGDLGDWMDRIDKSQWWLVEQTAAAYTAQIAAALAYCHSRQVYHRDLRPSSIQLSSKMPDATIMIADFGLAEILDPDLTFAQRIPNPYAAPELRSHTGRVSGGAPDVWSLGAIVHALLVGHPPSDEGLNLSPTRLLSGVSDKDAWIGRSAEGHDMVQWLLQPAGHRPTAARILNHKWLKTSILPSFPSVNQQDSTKEARKKQLCYLLGVLLVPAEVTAEEMGVLRAAFQQADHDYDGLMQSGEALELLHSLHQSSQAPPRPTWRAGIEEALQAADVRSTGVVDLCLVASALALARARSDKANMQSPMQQPRSPTSPSARRLLMEDEFVQSGLGAFFNAYADPRSRLVPTADLAERLRSPAGQELEAYGGVSYEEMLSVFSDIDYVDRTCLVTELLGGAARGTPLWWGSDPISQEVEVENCWEPSEISMDRIDNFFRSVFFMSCGLDAGSKGKPLFEMDCSTPAQ